MQNVGRCWAFHSVEPKYKVVFLNVGFAFIIGNSGLKTGETVELLVIELKMGFIMQMFE